MVPLMGPGQSSVGAFPSVLIPQISEARVLAEGTETAFCALYRHAI